MVEWRSRPTICQISFRHGMIVLFGTEAILVSAPLVANNVFLTVITKQTEPIWKGHDMFFSDRPVRIAKNELGFQPPSAW